MDSRVTARTKARARAARPAYCAPITDASAGSASATWRVRALPWPDRVGREPEDGLSLGNSEDALPPGFSADPLPLRNGSLPTPSCEVTPLGWGTVVATPGTAAAEVDTLGAAAGEVAAELEGDAEWDGGVDGDVDVDADADGDGDADAGGAVTVIALPAFEYRMTKSESLAVTVSVTDLTEVADFGICTWARNGMGCVPESTVPMGHELVPFVSQPEPNRGFRLVGGAESLSVTLLTLPPWDHTFTSHCAVCPRTTLVLSLCTLTLTHRYVLLVVGVTDGLTEVLEADAVEDWLGFADVLGD